MTTHRDLRPSETKQGRPTRAPTQQRATTDPDRRSPTAARRRALLVWLFGACLAASAVAAPLARADGDPASDYLLRSKVFLSAEATGVASPAGRALVGTVAAANRAGFAVRVAVIPTSYDLGSVVPLWRHPQEYAHFLGIELSLVYRQRLLVVMPNGFGYYWSGHGTTGESALLARLPTGETAGQLFAAARSAVVRLAAADGITVSAPTSSTSAPAGSSDLAIILIGTVGAVIFALVLLAVARRRSGRWRRRLAATRSGRVVLGARIERTREGSLGPDAAATARRHHLAPTVAALVIATLLLGGAIVGVIVLRPSAATSDAATTAKGGPAFRWPAGRQIAPDFTLTDQNGRTVSLAAYRGRPVIITFVDPLCRNLCPLEAQVLNSMDRQLPPSERPAILAVSVDVWADSRADLLQDFDRWNLVPQWRWAVGSPAALRAVWKNYAIQVYVDTKRIAGTTIHEITHIEGAYLVDGTGHARALFLWPFTPQDVESTLQQLR